MHTTETRSRHTLNIDPVVAHGLKLIAALDGVSMSALANQVLVRYFATRPELAAVLSRQGLLPPQAGAPAQP